jgi:hypothetical protein
MKLYRIAGGINWYGTQVDAKAGARQLGRTFEQVEVPTDKEGLLNWLNSNTVIDGHTEDARPSDDVDELREAELRAIAAAAKPTAPAINTNWTATDVTDFVLNRATISQVENIFACLGTRFKEVVNQQQ